ncbi:MAG: hypothetical protein M3Y28_06735 [Armatimonadota bacterium]|nr:hypothetical protein [Armatimonadota bacterium]
MKTLPLIAVALAVCLPTGPCLAKAAKSHGKSTAHKSAKHSQAKSADSSTWKPDPKLLSQLQPERAFGSYLMRIPKGYTVEEKITNIDGGQIARYTFKGPANADGSVPQMYIVTALAGPGYVALSVDTLFKNEKFLDDKPGLTVTDLQDGNDGALDLSREYFKFQDNTDKMQWVHGFRYAATDSRTNIQIIFGDQEPNNKTTLPLAEAAVLTLHKSE